MSNLTPRRLEALAMGVLHGNPHRGYFRHRGARSNMGGASARMIDELVRERLLAKRHGVDDSPMTVAGVDLVLANIDKVPNPPRAEVRVAAAALRPKLEERERLAQEEAGRRFDEAKERVRAKQAERAARIPVKLGEFAERFGVVILERANSGVDKPLADRLVELWDAIADADAAL